MDIDKFSKGLEQFDNTNLFVIDFSTVVNINSQDTLNILIRYILENSIKVAVSKEFYENYEVIIKSTNDEQKVIARLTHSFLESLEKNDCLLYMGNMLNSREIVNKLYKNPKVCFVYYKNSEISENIINFSDVLSAKCIIVDENGEPNICNAKEDVIKVSVKTVDMDVVDDNYFITSFDPNEGVKVRVKSGTIYTLGAILGSGGEGAVYGCNEEQDYVIKIYHKGQLNKLRLKKLFMMEKKQVRYEGVCWPEKVVFSEKGEPIGYMMKKISGKPLSAIFDGDESVLKAFPNWKKQNIILLTIDILQKIQYLHLLGIIVGDLRLKNIVINTEGMPCIVDIDSCQIDVLPCPTGYLDFTPPELQHVEFKKQLRTYYNESFSCAVLIFKLLFCGLHPYNQKFTSKTFEESISSLEFPYPKDIKGDFSRIPWGGYADMWKHLPFQMQNFLYSIFKLGQRYNLQEMILMLKTYNEFLNIKKSTIPSLNEISFGED